MSAKSKKQSKRQPKVGKGLRTVLAAIIIVSIAAAGSYYVSFARADCNTGDGHAGCSDNPGDQGYSWPDPATIPDVENRQVGQQQNRIVYTHVPPVSWLRNPNARMHLTLSVEDGTSKYVSPPGYHCEAAFTCVPSNRTREYGSNGGDGFKICADVDASNYDKILKVVTAPFIMQEPRRTSSGSTLNDFLDIAWAWSEGTCYAPTNFVLYSVEMTSWTNGGRSGGIYAASGPGFGPDVSSGPAPSGSGPSGAGGNGDGSDGTGTGNGKSGIGKGKSGGGGASSNSAVKQSQLDNSVPKSTNQGSTSQKTIEPSPFYDGRKYISGSDAKEILGISVAERTLHGSWSLLVGLGVATVVGTFYGMRWLRKYKSVKNTKRK